MNGNEQQPMPKVSSVYREIIKTLTDPKLAKRAALVWNQAMPELQIDIDDPDAPWNQPQPVEDATMPDTVCWATSTPMFGPKSYFVLIKDKEQIALEIKWDATEREVTADVYTPEDYSYTIHDGCDHANDDCILDDPDFYERQSIDMKASQLGIGVKPEQGASDEKQ